MDDGDTKTTWRIPQYTTDKLGNVYVKRSGGRLNKKDGLTRYGNSHVKDKTVSPTVLSLTWESPYLGKTVFILRRGPHSYKNKEQKVYIRESTALSYHPE